MFEKFAMKPCYLLLTPFFCVVYSQDTLTVNTKNNFQYFSVLELMNCCRFQKPMTKPIMKESIAI